MYLVIGLGVSGKSAVRFLKAHGHKVVTYDDQVGVVPEGYERVIVSPGVPRDHFLVQDARERGLEVIGEMELGLRYLDRPAIGITGSKGKTTTVLLITHVLNYCGIGAEALGNVGVPLTSGSEGVAVIEVSSFQLETMSSKVLDAAAVLNVIPDHLDRYASFEEYRKTKYKIRECLKEEGEFYEGDVAFPIVQQFGVSRKAFDEAKKSFRRPRHRMEVVGTFDGVTYINDSKGTCPASTLYAMDQIKGPIVLIAGGRDKQVGYESWANAFQNRVEKVCLIGEAKQQIAAALAEVVPTESYRTLKEAVSAAKSVCPEGGTVLLSPGCSSFDMFTDYVARGEAFCEEVR